MQALVSEGLLDSLFGFEGAGESAHPLEKKRAYKRTRMKFSLHTFFFKRKYAPLAQLVEQLTLNQWVPGSNP